MPTGTPTGISALSSLFVRADDRKKDFLRGHSIEEELAWIISRRTDASTVFDRATLATDAFHHRFQSKRLASSGRETKLILILIATKFKITLGSPISRY